MSITTVCVLGKDDKCILGDDMGALFDLCPCTMYCMH